MNNVEFEANIIEEGNDNSGKFVILDHTQFYPDGKGGQLGDRGTIEGASVVKVVEIDSDKIVHYVDEFPSSQIVRCQIDGKRRRDISIQHTAQHILSSSFLKLSGIETVGFHMSDDYTTVDLDAGDIDESIILKAEFLANEVVLDNREVKKYYVSEADLDRLNIRKKENIGNRIRIVEIDDFDLSMCGGTHVDFTGEIGIIKIIKREKIKKTNIRLFFVAGERALIDYEKKLRIVSDISNFLTTGEDDIFAKVHSLVEENRNLYKEIRANQDEIFKGIAEHLSEHAEMVEGIKYIFKVLDGYSRENISMLGKILSAQPHSLSFVAGKDGNFFGALSAEKPLNLANIKELLKDYIKRSWGGKNFIFFEFNENVKLDDINSLIKSNIQGIY